MLLVYTHKITPRVTYAFKHVCTRILGISVKFTTRVEELIAHQGLKLSYTHKRLGNEMHIRSADLLFEQGVLAMDVHVQSWDGVPCIFQIKDATAAIPFDIFAATFYMLSRYEEYLPHVKDELGRFPSSESLGVAHNFVRIPVVDIWIKRFGKMLSDNFPSIVLKNLVPDTEMMVTVPQAFKYKKIGFLRTIGGFIRDVSKLRLRENLQRTQVLLGLRRDPYDSFGWLINVQKQVEKPFKVFFQLGDYGQSSKNIKHSKRSFQNTLKMVADYCSVGLLISPAASKETDHLRKEKQRLEEIVHRPLKGIHISCFRLNLPHIYRDALDREIQEDYTMGYPDAIGFRAGTSQSFLYYDLDYEIQTPLMIHPVCMQSDALINYQNNTIDFVSLKDMQRAVHNVGGVFRISFRSVSFDGISNKKLFKRVVFDE